MQIDQKCRNTEMQYAEYAICIVIRLFKIHWRKMGEGNRWSGDRLRKGAWKESGMTLKVTTAGRREITCKDKSVFEKLKICCLGIGCELRRQKI